MPPHSENVNDIPYVDVEPRLRRRRKRSRSTSPFFLRRSPREQSTLTKSGSNSSLSSSRSSRSSSVVSEFRVSLSLTEFTKARSVEKQLAHVYNAKLIVDFHEAPEFMQFNPFIVRGYRTNLCRITCLKRLVPFFRLPLFVTLYTYLTDCVSFSMWRVKACVFCQFCMFDCISN